MTTNLQQFFTAQALHFTESRIEAMARPYRLPLPVVLDDGYYFLRTRQAVTAAFQAKRDGVTAAGLKGLRVGLLAEQLARRDHMMADVEWFYFGASGRREARTRVRYYLGRHRDGLAVEMIEFVELAFPEIRNWYVVYATGPHPPPRSGRPH